jgi:hypothetical protein
VEKIKSSVRERTQVGISSMFQEPAEALIIKDSGCTSMNRKLIEDKNIAL